MGRKILKKFLPLLIVGLMLASSFAILGGVRGAEMPTDTRAYGSAGKILYIYGDNKSIANEWREYLVEKNYAVDMLPDDGVSNANYYRYNLIIIGTNATGIGAEERKHMYFSDVPILGVGVGGGLVLPTMGLTTYLYTSSSGTSGVDALNISLYQTPNSISGVPGEILMYNNMASDIYLLKKSERSLNDTLFIGNWTLNNDYATIAQVNQYMFYGYIQSPRDITTGGDRILENIIYYMDKNHGYNVYIPRMLSRITMDGEFSTLFEWYGAHFIKLDNTWDNYTAIMEDENYIYLYLNMVNTSSTSDYMSVEFEKNNSRSSEMEISLFYVILSETSGHKGVTYRYITSSGVWSDFTAPDGSNIDAKWVWKSTYNTAEIRISKTYLGMNKSSDQLLGFRIGWSGNNYPSTAPYNNPSTFITAYSQSHWNGQYEEISTPVSYLAPTIDGKMNADEWNGASEYYTEDMTEHFVYVRSMADTSYLYLGGYITNVSGEESTIMFYFDTNGDGGSAPQTDDFRFIASKLDNDTFEYWELHGTGSGWSGYEEPTNAAMKMTMRGPYVYYEIRIPLNVLRITPGTFKDVHMRLHTYINSYRYTVPYDSDYVKPDEWTLLLTSPSAWGNNNMTFDAHNGTAVTLDGVKSEGEWDDAFHYTYPVSDTLKNLDMYVKTYEDKLYILAYYPNPTDSSYTYIDIGFDVDYNHNGALKAGDFAIEVNYNGGVMEWGVSSGNWVYTTPSGWEFAMDNSSSSWTVEIAINYSKLNITAGDIKDVGIIMYMVDDGEGWQTEPRKGYWFNTSTWNRITSSDDWGEDVTIPEFSDGVLAIMLVAVFGVMAVVVKRRR